MKEKSSYSEQSEAGGDTKKKREDSSTTSFSENDDVFLEGLKSDDFRRILANCFQNIQGKIEELFTMFRKNNETQIRGEKQLEDLIDSVKFMSSKCDEYVKERLEREARIVELESKVVSLSTKVEMLEYTADKMEQYSRRNSIQIRCLPEVKGENTNSLVIKTVKEKMSLDILSADMIESIDLMPLLNNQVKLDLLLLSLFGTTTGEKFIQIKNY